MLIHVGYHKTATSFLQRHLFSQSSLGFRCIADRRALRLMFNCANPFEVTGADLRERVTHALSVAGEPAPVDVVSFEQLSGQPWGEGYGLRRRHRNLGRRETADLLKDAFPEAKILIVVREQKSAIKSIYKYLVNGWQGRLSASIGQFLDQTAFEQEQNAVLFDPAHLEYHAFVACYRERFGPQNVLVIPYELLLRDEASFVNAICAHVGVAPAGRLGSKGRTNQSPSALACEIVRPFKRVLSSPNRPGMQSGLERKVSRFASRLAARLPASLASAAERRLERGIEQAVAGRYGQSNARLQQITGLDLEALGYEVSGDS